MKRVFALLLLAVIAMSCTACMGGADSTDTSKDVNDMQYAFGVPTPSTQDLSQLSYTKAAAVDPLYMKGNKNGYTMVSSTASVFEIGGCAHPDDNQGLFYRLDIYAADTYSSDNRSFAYHTSGITVRFCTDAPSILIDAEIYRAQKSNAGHLNGRGVCGFDVYVGTGSDRVYCGKSGQTMTSETQVTEEITLPGGYQEVQINLPLYAGVKSLNIGFPEGASVALPTERAYGDIVFYGSSITQGACASRPGCAYANILGRSLNANVHNLGFSGSAKGEQSIAQYIASLDGISAFVMDYDHNNSIAGLQETHYAFYKTVRDAHPDIPIIFVSRPVYLREPTADQLSRVQIIQDTYDKAVAEGDANVYFVKGEDFFPDDYPDLYMVDGTHPNDLGMYYMAKTIYPVLKDALSKSAG